MRGLLGEEASSSHNCLLVDGAVLEEGRGEEGGGVGSGGEVREKRGERREKGGGDGGER